MSNLFHGSSEVPDVFPDLYSVFFGFFWVEQLPCVFIHLLLLRSPSQYIFRASGTPFLESWNLTPSTSDRLAQSSAASSVHWKIKKGNHCAYWSKPETRGQPRDFSNLSQCFLWDCSRVPRERVCFLERGNNWSNLVIVPMGAHFCPFIEHFWTRRQQFFSEKVISPSFCASVLIL